MVAAAELPTIHQAMARVLADLPAIGKNQQNQQQGFRFRGIDDVLDALNPILAKHGVFFVPTVLERLASSRQTKSGSTMWVVDLHVEYNFYGPAGDSVTASGWGEGTDSGDKATQKAMTGAMKYVLFQVFAIATNEQAESDSDRTSPPQSARRPQKSEGESTDRVTPAADGQSPSDSSRAGESRANAGPSSSSPPEGDGPATSRARRDRLKSKCVALQADGVSVADAREAVKLPLVDSCDEEQLTRFEHMVADLEQALEAPFGKVSS